MIISDPQLNITIEELGSTVAGQQYSIQCIVDAFNILTVNPELRWERVSDNGAIELLDNTSLTSEDKRTILTLNFTNVLTSSGGIYRCIAELESNGFTIARLERNTTITVTSKLQQWQYCRIILIIIIFNQSLKPM